MTKLLQRILSLLALLSIFLVQYSQSSSIIKVDSILRRVTSASGPINMSSQLSSGTVVFWEGKLAEGSEMRRKFGISSTGPYSPVVLKFGNIAVFENLADQLKNDIDQTLVRTQLSHGALSPRKDFPFSLHATCGYLKGSHVEYS